VLGRLVDGSSTEPPVTLGSNASGIRLAFDTNQPGVQLYTGNGFTGEGTRKRIHTGGSTVPGGYKPGTACFLEFHEPIAAWLHLWGQAPEKDTLLTSEELYNNYTKLTVHFKPIVGPE